MGESLGWADILSRCCHKERCDGHTVVVRDLAEYSESEACAGN